jgi:hypothetical protein
MAFDPFTAGFDLAKTVLDKFFPDANEEMRQKFEQAASEIQNEYNLMLNQLEINKVEASSSSLFVSGWRPAVGWVCVAGMTYVSLIEPLARFISVVFFAYTGVFPLIDTTITSQVLFGLLGFGGFRMYEKIKGVASK